MAIYISEVLHAHMRGSWRDPSRYCLMLRALSLGVLITVQARFFTLFFYILAGKDETPFDYKKINVEAFNLFHIMRGSVFCFKRKKCEGY
jgi:hypothetical protein